MVSICPKCHHEVDHEDYLFEVVCSCGVRFNPFMGSQGSIEKHQGKPLAAQPTQSVSESAAAFSAIREFGESLSYHLKSSPASPPKGAASVGSISIRGHYLGTADVVGLCSTLSRIGDKDRPLEFAVQALELRARELGADGLIDFCWQVMPDGQTVLACATAVRLPHPS